MKPHLHPSRSFLLSILAAIFMILGGFEKAAGWLSGAVVEDASGAIENLDAWWSELPVLGHPTFQGVSVVTSIVLFVFVLCSFAPQAVIAVLSWFPIRCRLCGGQGKQFDTYKCDTCNGFGKFPGRYRKYPKCKYCNGSGIGVTEFYSCDTCNGTGRRVPKAELQDFMET